MAVIIYGHRPYGTVDTYGGEHAETRFIHLWFLPLIPIRSYWITGEDTANRTGHPIRMYAKSVLAGYLRVWGPIVALGTFVAGTEGSPLWLAVSALAIAATAWTWTWRSLRGEAARRRSDFNLVAFGTRCEPRRMRGEERGELKRALDERWHARKPDRTPEDIARHGTKDATEAVIAYGLLRLGAALRGRAGRDEDRDADRILAGAHSTFAVGEGPYREGPNEQPAAGSLATVVHEMAVEHERLRESSPEARARRAAAAKRRSRKQLIGLIVATPIGIAGVAGFVSAMRPTLDVTFADLRGIHPPLDRTVRVACDSVEGPVWEEVDRSGDATHQIAMCASGNYLLPVRLDADMQLPQGHVTGTLLEVDDSALWVSDGLRADPEIDARSLEVFVDASNPNDKLYSGIFGLALALAVPVLWVLWLRARKRRKAAESAA